MKCLNYKPVKPDLQSQMLSIQFPLFKHPPGQTL